MHLIHRALEGANPELPAVLIRVDRFKLGRRLWRGAADDGVEFGFEVEASLQHGDVVWAGERARYVIAQAPESVVAIALPADRDLAALLGWSIGNLHFPIALAPGRLLAPDDLAVRQTLDRLGVAYEIASEIFRPHRFASAAGHSHGHANGGADLSSRGFVYAAERKS